MELSLALHGFSNTHPLYDRYPLIVVLTAIQGVSNIHSGVAHSHGLSWEYPWLEITVALILTYFKGAWHRAWKAEPNK
jgi:hypothetical protein